MIFKEFDTEGFAKRLRKAREEQHKVKVSLDTMAQDLDLSKSGLQNSEITNPDNRRYGYNQGMGATTLFKIAQYHGISTDYLLGLSDDPARVPSAVDDLGLSPEAVQNLVEWKEKKPLRLKVLNALICAQQAQTALDAFGDYLKLRLDYSDLLSLEERHQVPEIETQCFDEVKAKLKEEGQLTFLTEKTLSVKASLTPFDIGRYQVQRGLDLIGIAVRNIYTRAAAQGRFKDWFK